jgi:3',5'-cyclic AMP phosphodiesterase CpdA
MFLLAHVSDPHLAPLPTVKLHELAGKRIGGFINWHRNRRRFHLPQVLEAIVADLKAQRPDHIAVTGDLVNLSLAAEFAPARAWLERLGPPERVTLVPGNHDAYVRASARHPELHWREYMSGDVPAPTSFPFVRRRGPLALIGLSTAVPAPPFRATGRLGAEQLSRLAQVLATLRGEGVFRVILIHHPPVSRPQDHHERLLDGAAFLDVLKEQGADLVLHGHEHAHSVRWFDAPGGQVPAIGVPSASGTVGGHDEPAAYNRYEVDGTPGAWRLTMVARGLRADSDGIVELARRQLA